MIVLRYLYIVALVVWVGGLVAAGGMVAPALFAVLPAEAGPEGRALAGAAFGEVLRRVLTVGEGAGVVMLVTMTVLRLLGPKPLTYGVRAVLLAAMLGASAYTAHVVLPEAEALRREMTLPSSAAADDPAPGPLRRPAQPVDHSGHRDGRGRTGGGRLGSPGVSASAMRHTITLIPGDGIGPEVTRAVVQVLEAAGLEATWESFSAGADAVAEHGTTLPPALLESIRRTKVALKGPVTTPIGEGFTSVNVGLRKALDLYANLRPVWNLPNVKSRYDGVDLVIVRENTEDLYAGLEHVVVPGVVESLKIITDAASTRIARFAFEHARRHQRATRHRGAQGQHHEARATGCSSTARAASPRTSPTSSTTSGSSMRPACSW